MHETEQAVSFKGHLSLVHAAAPAATTSSQSLMSSGDLLERLFIALLRLHANQRLDDLSVLEQQNGRNRVDIELAG